MTPVDFIAVFSSCFPQCSTQPAIIQTQQSYYLNHPQIFSLTANNASVLTLAYQDDGCIWTSPLSFYIVGQKQYVKEYYVLILSFHLKVERPATTTQHASDNMANLL